jgi:hypothetical protein
MTHITLLSHRTGRAYVRCNPLNVAVGHVYNMDTTVIFVGSAMGAHRIRDVINAHVLAPAELTFTDLLEE